MVAQQVRAYVILAEGLGSVPSTHGAAPVSSSRDLMPPCVPPRTRHAHIHIEKHSDKKKILGNL